ncbi:hypothetical protein KAU09_03025 [Candidatus Parcubacteria bacterium]|nr:hypothetical protein [Candidatus Parcubacteria bacterium]
MFKVIKFLIIFLFLFPAMASASSLRLVSDRDAYGPGDNFAVDVLIDNVEMCVNVISVNLNYPNDYLNLIDFIEGESLINLWLEKPGQKEITKANANGEINFIGGVPGGYCGHIPGDPGKSNLLARLIFAIPGLIISDVERDELRIDFLDSTKVLLNDGFGTEDNLETLEIKLKVLDSPALKSGEWKNQISSDKIKPEPFIIELRQDKGVFENQYYINFYTTDKQSGIDRYEVLEIKPDYEVGIVSKLSWWEKVIGKKLYIPEWKEAAMPYLLEDQNLESTIKVRAIDKAGNERYVEYVPPEELRIKVEKTSNNLPYMLLFIAGAVIILILLFFLIIAIKKKKNVQKNKEE